MSEKRAPAIQTPIKTSGLGWALIGEEEIAAVTAVLRDPETMFRYRGDIPGQCGMFEEEVTKMLGVRHALFVNSGTAALTCCLSALG
nr:DegT/DnrJ/EryC1/StrS family aminotransferase [bacterium]